MNEITAIRPLTDQQALDLVSASTLLELQENILDVALSRHGRETRRRRTVALRAGRPRRWVAGGAVATAALAAALLLSFSGHVPNVAQAFPILNGSSTITPSELHRSLIYYGVSAGNNDGINIGHGHPVSTRWGTGYVLTSPRRTAICVVAPGLDSHDWGAACAPQSLAITTGVFYEYAYDSALHSARLIGLYPRGAVVTTTTRGGIRHRERLVNGVLSINVSRPEQIAITIAHHTAIDRVAPKDAHPVYGSASGSPSATSTTVTGTPTITNP
ncbi:MAG: hypothetical protein ABI355_06615 [Solirubrobacteraceae bacterium]